MSDVLFVRELAAGKDLVLAFAADGSPAWALDRESGIQWWYAVGDVTAVRRAIRDNWDTFETMPVVARSSTGPHPAVELGRRTSRPRRPARSAYRRASTWMSPYPGPGSPVAAVASAPAAERHAAARRLAVITGLVLAALVVVPLVIGSVLGWFGAPASDDPVTVPAALEVADTPCTVRGFVAHDPAGHVLVCVPPDRAMPSVLTWRSTG